MTPRLHWRLRMDNFWGFLARDAFVRTNRRAIAIMFVRLSGTGVYCDHTVHFSADLGLLSVGQSNVLDTLTGLTPKYVHLLQASFSSCTWKRGGIWMCRL